MPMGNDGILCDRIATIEGKFIWDVNEGVLSLMVGGNMAKESYHLELDV